MTPSEVRQTDHETEIRTPATGKPAVETRQGVISGRVLTVLLISVCLAVAALAIAYLVMRP